MNSPMFEALYAEINRMMESYGTSLSFDEVLAMLKAHHERKYEEFCKQFDANIMAAMESGNLKMVTCKGLE